MAKALVPLFQQILGRKVQTHFMVGRPSNPCPNAATAGADRPPAGQSNLGPTKPKPHPDQPLGRAFPPAFKNAWQAKPLIYGPVRAMVMPRHPPSGSIGTAHRFVRQAVIARGQHGFKNDGFRKPPGTIRFTQRAATTQENTAPVLEGR
jgi:hypothetical protein